MLFIRNDNIQTALRGSILPYYIKYHLQKHIPPKISQSVRTKSPGKNGVFTNLLTSDWFIVKIIPQPTGLEVARIVVDWLKPI